MRQVLADTLGRRVRRAEIEAASAKGAAVLAGAPAPTFASRPAETPGPDAGAHREAFQRARRTYRALRASRDAEPLSP